MQQQALVHAQVMELEQTLVARQLQLRKCQAMDTLCMFEIMLEQLEMHIIITVQQKQLIAAHVYIMHQLVLE